MKTIHLIAHAHIDPVWLWPWQTGVDESLNTCHSICNLLDRHPDLIFTQGDAWIYEQVEQLDPALFARIKERIARGQWEPIGGWYVQPDCNLPSAWGLDKQIELGRAYFERALGVFPTIAYNTDSFGHAASLPDIMARHGQTHYIMMRPKCDEMNLPARLFRWQGHDGGPEIITYRIPVSYNTPHGMNVEHVAGSLTELPPGIEHTMCFFGCSDHGGGPSETMVNWIHENKDAIAGARMIFSSPSRYFKAVANQCADLPLVTGDLQMHAVGCYSVHRAIKRQVRKAEHLLDQAEMASGPKPLIEEAWRKVCFNHFHDTLCGSSLASVYEQAADQVGFANSVADDILQRALRLETRNVPADHRQQMILRNYGERDFDDWIEHEPWLEFTAWQPGWTVIDEDSRPVPHQVMLCEAFTSEMSRILFPLRVPAGGMRRLRIDSSGRFQQPAAAPIAEHAWAPPALELVEDYSDTWSHEVASYEGKIVARAKWDAPRIVNDGPLMRSQVMDGSIGSSRLTAEWRHYAGEPFHELRLRVLWQEEFRILRLVWQPGCEIVNRADGIPGGTLIRQSDAKERPVRDLTLLSLADGRQMGVVFPDAYSLSATPCELRLTLLRSSLMAQGGNIDMKRENRIFSDHGPQDFIFRFYPEMADLSAMEAAALAFHRRPLICDDTRGMPWRPHAHQTERPV